MKNINIKKIAVCGSLLMSSVGFNCAMQTGPEQKVGSLKKQQNGSGCTNVNLSENIDSNYILKDIFNYISEKKKLYITKYNKVIQNKLYISKKDYKEYNIIKIEIKMCEKEELYNPSKILSNFSCLHISI